MRKEIPNSALILLCLATTLIGSSFARAEIRLDAAGFESGANFNRYSTTPDAQTDHRVGAIVGGQVELPLGGDFAFTPGLRFTQKGFNFDQVFSGNPVHASAYANYLEVPLIAKATFLPYSPVRPFVFAGPDLGVKLGTTASATFNGSSVSVNGLNFNPFAFSIESGLGAEYSFNRASRIFLQAEYSNDLMNVSADSQFNWKARGLQLVAGMMFEIESP